MEIDLRVVGAERAPGECIVGLMLWSLPRLLLPLQEFVDRRGLVTHVVQPSAPKQDMVVRVGVDGSKKNDVEFGGCGAYQPG